MNAGIIALIVSFLGFFGALLFITYKFYKFTNENTK